MVVGKKILTEKEDPSSPLYARIRKKDVVLREHFSKINNSDRADEIRCLLELGILAEREGK